MELIRKYAARHPTGLAAYLALEVALMRRFVARGGTEEEFCRRLAAAFHRRYAPALLGSLARMPGTRAPLRLVTTPREEARTTRHALAAAPAA